MYRRYTSQEITEFEEAGELYVCQSCDYHGHADDFGATCPSCGEPLDDDSDEAAS